MQPKFLYHGTSASYLESILKNGLLPRNQSGISQWGHSVESNASAVYLTSCYPLHFAMNAVDEGDIIVVEVDVSTLAQDCLVADEDALAYCINEPQTSGMSFMERVRHYKDRLHQYPASFSLDRLGTCAHLGSIKTSSISRIARIPDDQVARLVFGGFDATVCKANFDMFGDEYAASIPWIFGDIDACARNPALSNSSFKVMKIEGF